MGSRTLHISNFQGKESRFLQFADGFFFCKDYSVLHRTSKGNYHFHGKKGFSDRTNVYNEQELMT